MLCLACQLQQPQQCQNCGSGLLPAVNQPVSNDRFPIFETAVGPGTYTSASFPRQGPNLVVEAFMQAAGTATVSVLEAPRGGQMMTGTDSAANSRSIGTTSRWMVKGVLADVAVQIVVASGAWSIWGCWNQQPSDRGNYYDRNPSIKTVDYEASGVAPAAETVRGTYTVPSGRKAYVESTYVRIYRESVASAPRPSELMIFYIPSGGTKIKLGDAVQNANGLYDPMIFAGAQLALLLPGDAVEVHTWDQSTGGTYNFNGAIKLCEFDT